jgi:hypothetical protein
MGSHGGLLQCNINQSLEKFSTHSLTSAQQLRMQLATDIKLAAHALISRAPQLLSNCPRGVHAAALRCNR